MVMVMRIMYHDVVVPGSLSVCLSDFSLLTEIKQLVRQFCKVFVHEVYSWLKCYYWSCTVQHNTFFFNFHRGGMNEVWLYFWCVHKLWLTFSKCKTHAMYWLDKYQNIYIYIYYMCVCVQVGIYFILFSFRF